MISENASNAAETEAVSTDLTELHRLNSILQRNNVTKENVIRMRKYMRRGIVQHDNTSTHQSSMFKVDCVMTGPIDDTNVRIKREQRPLHHRITTKN